MTDDLSGNCFRIDDELYGYSEVKALIVEIAALRTRMQLSHDISNGFSIAMIAAEAELEFMSTIQEANDVEITALMEDNVKLERQLAALREAIELCERTRKYNGSGGTCKAHIDSMEALLGEQR